MSEYDELKLELLSIKAKSKKCKNFILASHSDQLTREFCNKGLWLEKGKIKMYEDINNVLEAFNK